MSWNYRIMKHVGRSPNNEEYLGMHEVYYDKDGKPNGYSSEPSFIGENLDELKWVLERMGEAVAKPILTEADCRGGTNA